MLNLLTTAHRVLFKNNMEIPEWLIDEIDSLEMLNTMAKRYNCPVHSSPADYGLTSDDVEKARLRYLRSVIKKKKDEYEKLLSLATMDSRYNKLALKKLEEVESWKRKLAAYKSSERNRIDFTQLKTIQIKPLAESYGIKVISTGNSRYKISCPFHNEKTPSCVLYGNSFYCFGCGEHGDAIDFVEKLDKTSTKEAAYKLWKTISF